MLNSEIIFDGDSSSIQPPKLEMVKPVVIGGISVRRVFKNQYGEACVEYVSPDGRITTSLVRSQEFSLYIKWLYFQSNGKAARKDDLESKIADIEAHALFSSETIHLAVRVAKHKDSYYYDLGNQVVRTCADGYFIENHPPTMFQRYRSNVEQVLPEEGGSIDRLFDFVNIQNPNDKLLAKVFVVTSLIPDIAHPICAIYGPQGSAKSTLCRILSALIDPSNTTEIAAGEMKEFMLAASHRWVLPLDNLAQLKDDFSDLLCKCVTGVGISKRKLYTDDEEFIRNFRRVVILNGINLPAKKADLLDRCIILELDRVKTHKRCSEQWLIEGFNRELGKILGACFDVLSKAMRIYPTLDVKELPRMADFALWGCAVTKAMGLNENEFLSAYNHNIKTQTEEALCASPLASVILEYLKKEEELKGTPSEVLHKLRSCIDLAGVNPRSFPQNAWSFGRRLLEIKTNLEALGYVVERGKDKNRFIHIYPLHM